MSTGNFLSALVQRGVQAGAGALQGRREGRDRVAGEARQAEEDALQRALVEARMATEQRQQAALDREAANFVPHAQEIEEEGARLQKAHEYQMALERLRGQNARGTAGVTRSSTRAGGGGRSDPRVGTITQRIARLRGDRTADLRIAGDRFRAIRDSAGVAEAGTRAQARADSIGTLERERDRIVGMGGEEEEGADAILGGAQTRRAGEADADWWERLVDSGMTEEDATAKVQSSPVP